MYKYKVAVIIPCYNAEKYISRCLDSVVSQSFSDLQIIFVDNLSTDSSASIVSSYAQSDKRILIVTSHNKGLPYAINDGLAACDAEYVCFIDADDYIKTDAIERLYSATKKYDADIVQCNYCRILIDGTEEVMNCFTEEKVFTGDDIFEATIRMVNFYNFMDPARGNGFFSHSRWGKLIRSELLKSNSSIVDLTMSIGEDFDRMLPVFIDSKVIVALNEVLYYYIKNPTSVTLGWAESRKSDNVKLINNAIRMTKIKGVYDKFEVPLLHKKCQIDTDYILRVCKQTCPYPEHRKLEEIRSMKSILNVTGVNYPSVFFRRNTLRLLLRLHAYKLILKLYKG